jgi:hypothetical protein
VWWDDFVKQILNHVAEANKSHRTLPSVSHQTLTLVLLSSKHTLRKGSEPMDHESKYFLLRLDCF